MTPLAHEDPPRSRAVGSVVLATGWALAEATIFFVVPDVYLTRVAMTDVRRALRLCLWATGAAVAGGVVLWIASDQGHAIPLLQTFLRLPGINNDVVGEAGRAIQEHGALALFPGALRGQPFKVFAVHAAVLGVPLLQFSVAALFARLSRFAATVLLAWSIRRLLSRLSDTQCGQLHTLAWLAFYTWYFAVMR